MSRKITTFLALNADSLVKRGGCLSRTEQLAATSRLSH